MVTVLAGCTSSYYPDADGWNRKALQGDSFQAFFPMTVNGGFYLASPEPDGRFLPKGPVQSSAAFIEYRDHTQNAMGPAEMPVTILRSRRSFYNREAFTEMPVLKVWVEEVSAEDFPAYKTAALQQLESFKGEATVEQMDYRQHEYAVYLRKVLSRDALQGKKTIGGAYVFFPEKNTVLFIAALNTKYTSDVYLISRDEFHTAIHQIIDSVVAQR